MRTQSWRVSAPSSLCPPLLAPIVPRFQQYKPSTILCSDNTSYLNDCENAFNGFSDYRCRGLASSGRTQPRASNCWTCGEVTSRPTAAAVGVFHLHPSSALPPLPLGMKTHPGCPGIPTAAPAAGYQRCVSEFISQGCICILLFRIPELESIDVMLQCFFTLSQSFCTTDCTKNQQHL